MSGYRQAYAEYVCARDGHQVIVSATHTGPQPFLGGTCTRCNRYIAPQSVVGVTATNPKDTP